MYVARHRGLTPAQQDRLEAYPHHFNIHYRHRHSLGDGHGNRWVGSNSAQLTPSEIEEAVETIKLVVIANVQADGHSIDPRSIVVEIERIEVAD